MSHHSNLLATVAPKPSLDATIDATIYDEADPLPPHYLALYEAVLPNRCRTVPRIPDAERAQKSADRTNAKRVAKFAGTLFADDAQLIGRLRTAEQVIERVAGQFDHQAAGDRMFFVRGTYYRHVFRTLKGEAECAAKEAHFMRVLPHAPHYWADFWWQRLKETAPDVLASIDRDRIPVLEEGALHAGVKGASA